MFDALSLAVLSEDGPHVHECHITLRHRRMSRLNHVDIGFGIESQHPRALGVGRRSRGEQRERDEQRGSSSESHHHLPPLRRKNCIRKPEVESPPMKLVREPQRYESNDDGQNYPKQDLDLKCPHTRDTCFLLPCVHHTGDGPTASD